jgi:hypothetical protein
MKTEYTLLKDLPGLSEGRIIYTHPDDDNYYTDGDSYTINKDVVVSNPDWFKEVN